MKVLVIPEDPTYNGYILKPLIERIMKEVGKPSARVEILTNPKLHGFETAKSKINEICERYKHFDLVLFLPDNDCKSERKENLSRLEAEKQSQGFSFVSVAAVEEVEVWLLAGHRDKLRIAWNEVRSDCSVKENIFNGFINQYGDDGPGRGREKLMKRTLRNFSGLLELCPELSLLKNKINSLLHN